MPLKMDEYDYLRETIEQVKGLTDLASERATANAEAPLPIDDLPVLLLALGRACDDAITVVKAVGNMHSGGAGESLQIANMASRRG